MARQPNFKEDLHIHRRLQDVIHAIHNRLREFTLDGVMKDAPNGEEYVTLCSGGIKNEGESTMTYSDIDKAINDYWESVARYIDSVKDANVVYWRARPGVVWDENGERCYVRSRLLVACI